MRCHDHVPFVAGSLLLLAACGSPRSAQDPAGESTRDESARAAIDGGAIEAGASNAAASVDAERVEPRNMLETALVLRANGIDAETLVVDGESELGTTLRFDVAPDDAIDVWRALRQQVRTLGRYPVVTRDTSENLLWTRDNAERSVTEILAAARAIDPAAWRVEREAADPDYYDPGDPGEWGELEPQTGYLVPWLDESGDPTEADGDLWITLVPTTVPWEAIAHFAYGHWNECPEPEVHVAVHRDWYERFGAELVGVDFDWVELRVARSPTEPAAAEALAHEQFLYSGGDLVFQGYGTLRALASSLVGAETWTFWWD